VSQEDRVRPSHGTQGQGASEARPPVKVEWEGLRRRRRAELRGSGSKAVGPAFHSTGRVLHTRTYASRMTSQVVVRETTEAEGSQTRRKTYILMNLFNSHVWTVELYGRVQNICQGFVIAVELRIPKRLFKELIRLRLSNYVTVRTEQSAVPGL
jgi:hypothetical protein